LRIQLAEVVLWLLVVSAGLLTGGSVFERLVVTPLWAASPPESVHAWPHGLVQGSFFRWASPAYALSSLATVTVSFFLPPGAALWARLAGGVGVLVIAWTAVFFIPILQKTEMSRGAGIPPGEVARLTQAFVTWGLWRTMLAFGGWLAAIRALTLIR